jgi:hypothetical protein
MIKTCQIRRTSDGGIILGIAYGDAIMEILTNDAQLQKCLKMLEQHQDGLISLKFGMFGDYPVVLNLRSNGVASVFIDGPSNDKHRNQCAGIMLAREDLERMLTDAVNGTKEAPGLTTIA